MERALPIKCEISTATGRAGCIGGHVGKAVKLYDMASNAISVSQGLDDMLEHGPTFSNVLQTAGGAFGLASGAASKCFTAGTQIVVGAEYDENDVFVRYVTVNIEDVEVGDLVYSYDTVTGVVSQNEVTDVFVRESDHINYLTIADENGNIQVLETTDGHPFCVVTDEPDLCRAANDYSDGMYHGALEVGRNGYWVEAKDLCEGDVFLGANGELSTLVSTERVQFDESIKVYNFSVDGDHDYFVIAQTGEYGQTCILVHNAKWYHGTDNDSANDILQNGLDKSKLAKNSRVDNANGLYVTDDPGMAKDYADLASNYKGGTVLEFDDADIGHLLVGDGTKLNEALIPVSSFEQVTPSMIKPAR